MKKTQINNLTLYLKEMEKEEQTKAEVCRRNCNYHKYQIRNK